MEQHAPGVILIPEGLDLYFRKEVSEGAKEDLMLEAFERYLAYAASEPLVIVGMDVFVWFDYDKFEDFYGVAHYPRLKARIQEVGKGLLGW